ncbi:MAG: circadian clock protein KaiC, partial [Methanomicrobiales archaeon]|nr:circadian clock protein KaiC [Methanomicrobiales archaeon]
MKAGKKIRVLEKCPTGIQGLDDITDGGLPKGRPTLICGGVGSGKTLLAMEFLARGALDHHEPGVYITFEERKDDLVQNFASMGLDLEDLIRKKKLIIDQIHINPAEITETGEFDLEGLFIRLGDNIDTIGAKRIALDTIDVLFSTFSNADIIRAELQRLFLWIKDHGITAIVTGEQGEGTLTRSGLEEYVADCVIILDNRLVNQISTRRIRVVKYRGSKHGTDEYPFLISEDGISILPVTSLSLMHTASSERVSTGIGRLDTMLGGKGFFRGSSVLITGEAGTGKTSIIAAFIDAACRRKERCLYFAFEESQSQIIRNMSSIGYDFQQWVDDGLLRFHAVRPTAFGLERHLAIMTKLIREFGPKVVAIDPISNLFPIGDDIQVRLMLMRLIDYLKSNNITSLYTNLTSEQALAPFGAEFTQAHVSSLMDSWIALKTVESNGERNRALYLIKSRGMGHSNQVREFVLSDNGIQLLDVYIGSEGVLLGSARSEQEIKARAGKLAQEQEIARKRRDLELKKRS